MVIYTVKRGDSVYKISKKYGISMQRIIADNQLENPNVLVPGQALVLRNDYLFHKAYQKQDISSIAKMYGVSEESLLAANPEIESTGQNLYGKMVLIPQPPNRKRAIEVNGYAFPYTSMNVINSTLPYLTYISVFSYQVKPDGSLIPIPDENIVNAALNGNVLPMMVITNIREGGSFDSDIAHVILTDEQVQNTLLANVIETLRDKNYRGLDIDFEYVFPDDRENYNRFLEKTVNALRPLGYTVVSAIAPKTKEDQPGLLYEAHDYKFHGSILDHVIIMTYEWGYTFVHT